MKTLGDLKVGDKFYLIEYDEGGFITNITERYVAIIKDISVGMIIKYFNNGELEGFTIQKDEYDENFAICYYLIYCCADLNYVKTLIKEDKKKFNNRYNNILNTIKNYECSNN